MRCHLQLIKENLITKINDLIKNPNKIQRSNAHEIHDFNGNFSKTYLVKSASKSQWTKFNELTNKAPGSKLF